MAKEPTRIGSGKGGDFNTRKNPFEQKGKIGSCPGIADHTKFGLACDAILQCECALIVGRTRDGGALVLTILDGEDRHRTYCSNDDELDAALTSIFQLYIK